MTSPESLFISLAAILVGAKLATLITTLITPPLLRMTYLSSKGARQQKEPPVVIASPSFMTGLVQAEEVVNLRLPGQGRVQRGGGGEMRH